MDYLDTYKHILIEALGFVYILVIFILPFILGLELFRSFARYTRNKFIQEKVSNAILLELTPPKHIFKSPLAMELFLTSLYQTSGESSWLDMLFKGKTRPWFSLEMCSFEGKIKFFLWTFDFWKPIVTSYLYAQYPEIVVNEVKDYSKTVHFDPKVNNIFGTQFVNTKADFYPIKTYNDYNLGDDPKEEFKVDPTTPFFEYLSTLGPDEQIWLQIVLRSHKKEKRKPGGKRSEKVDWQYFAREEIKKLKKEDVQSAGEIKITGASLSKGEKEVIDAIERNISKLAFDTVIRTIYIAPKEKFNPLNIVGLIGAFRQYNTGNLNGFGVDGHHITTFDYPWQDFREMRVNARKRHILHYYQERSAYHEPSKSHYFTMSTEEVATIYHFPTETAVTSAIDRVEAKRVEPPNNLPI